MLHHYLVMICKILIRIQIRDPQCEKPDLFLEGFPRFLLEILLSGSGSAFRIRDPAPGDQNVDPTGPDPLILLISIG